MIKHSPAKTIAGGGRCRLLAFVTIVIASLWQTMAAAAVPDLPKSEDELKVAVRSAIETGDFEAFERMVHWTGISPYKRRIVSAQIRHSLSRPIEKIEIETADMETRRDLQSIGDLRLNLPVIDLLRVTYADEPGEHGAPTTVFLIGKLDGAYRIVLLVKKKTGVDVD